VRRLAILVAALMVAGAASAATVVLSGGKRLEVTSYTVGGSYVVVHYSNGRVESYPLAVVDLAATRAAAGTTTAAPTGEHAGEPHSPFFAAKSSAGKSGVVVTDADVKHVETGDEGVAPEEEKKDEGAQETGTQVTLVSYAKKKVAEGEWDITATVANVGTTAVNGVNAVMRVLDDQGKPVATGSGSFPGRLEPGKQATITAHVALQGEPFQVAVDLSWREIRPNPQPAATPGPAAASPGAQRTTPQASATAPTGWTVAAGASPSTLPANVMALPAPNTLGAAAQVPREKPKT
jgi:hypothetical protein